MRGSPKFQPGNDGFCGQTTVTYSTSNYYIVKYTEGQKKCPQVIHSIIPTNRSVQAVNEKICYEKFNCNTEVLILLDFQIFSLFKLREII